ncbi:MAG: hypothetical protein HY877_06980, partial [Deltaproteobacteria bacterium]|nr:hypothetical protein [Deltaproteobacteria bacterium]
ITEIGTGNIAAINTKTASINWADVTGLVTSAGAIQAKTDTIDWTNVTGIKTKTDTIAWADVSGIKTKTDTINWTDVTTAKNNVATILTQTGDIAAVKTKTDTIAWADVTGIVTATGAIQAKTDTIDWTNVTGIKTKTDTIAWADVTGVKAKTDTINWTDVTTAKNDVATVLTQTGDIAAIKTKTDTIAWADVTGLVTTSGAIKAKTDTIDWTNVAAIKTKTDTINWADVTGVKAKTDTINWTDVTTAKNNVATLITEIGTGNISAINTKTASINWADVTGLVTTTNTIQAKTDPIDWTNVSAIKTKTDTINWDQITGIKTKTDTIDWTNVTGLVNEIGTGNIAAIKTKTQSINWADVTDIVTKAGTIQQKTDPINWADVATIKTKTGTIDWNSITGIKMKTDMIDWSEVGMATADLANLRGMMGSPEDPAYSNTVFGLVKDVKNKWGTKTADELFTQTMGAYDKVTELQEKFGYEEGAAGGGSMYEDLRLLKDYVDQVGTKVTTVRSELGTMGTELGTKVTTVGTELGTKVTTVGTEVGGVSGDVVGSLNYKLDTLLRGMLSVNTNVNTLDTSLDSLTTTVGTVNTAASTLSTNLSSAKTNIDSILTKINSGLSVDTGTINTALSSVTSLLGGASDSSSSSSVFGKIAGVSGSLTTIGKDATNASTYASNASSTASRAASAAEEAKAALTTTGSSSDATKSALTSLSDKLGKVQSDVTKIASGVSTDSLKTGLTEAMAKVGEMAASQGHPGMEKLAQPATAADVKSLQDQIERVKAMLDVLTTMAKQQKGFEAPVVKTWYESGSVLLKVLIVNPSKEESFTVPVRIPLPKEATRESVMDAGDLKVGFNAEKGIYEAYGETTLKPAEEKVLQVRLQDIWRIPDGEITFQKGYASELVKLLKDNWKYSEAAKKLGETIQTRLDNILTSQDEDVGPAKHIEVHRKNLLVFQEIKKDTAFLEKLAGEGMGFKKGGGAGGGSGEGPGGPGGPSGFPGKNAGEGAEGDMGRWVEGATLGLGETSEGQEGSGTTEVEKVTLKVEVKNPSQTEATRIAVKHYLPKEVLEKDVLDRGLLEVLHDLEQGRLYLYKDAVDLKPADIKIFEVILRDIWRLPEGVLLGIQERAKALAKALDGTTFSEEANLLSKEIVEGVSGLRQNQGKESGLGEHVEIFHQSLSFLETIKNRIDKLEKMAGLITVAPGVQAKDLGLGKVAYVAAGRGGAGGSAGGSVGVGGGSGEGPGGPKGSEALKMVAESIFAGGAPATSTTWRIIFVIVGFLGVISFLFFVLWWAQVRAEKSVKVEEIK